MTRVLILDDRPINRQFLTTLLRYKGFETREASDGREGLEVAREWPPDLAIVDIEMPGMDGVAFVHHLHADPQLAPLPVIFYTASYEASEAFRMAKECGVDYVLMKPTEPEVILATVDKALGRSTEQPRSEIAEAAAAEFLHLHADALRTSALVEFHLEVAAQRQPVEILKILSRAVRNVVASQHSVVAIFDGDQTFGYSSSHDERTPLPNEAKGWPAGCVEHLKALLRESHLIRTTRELDRDICEIWSVDVRSYFGLPIETAKMRYGWLSLMNREGAPHYTIEDERIALTIVAQAATAYENLLLYEEVRKEAELLDHNVSLLRATIEASGDGILVIDNQGRYVTFNQAFVDIWHMPQSILSSGEAERSRQHTLSQVKDPKALDAVMKSEASNDEVAGTLEMLDGRFIECHAGPRHFDGQVIGRVWTFRDLTARMRAEETLRRVARDRELLLESTGEGIYALDTEGRCTMANHVAANLLGRTLAEMIGSRMHQLNHHHKPDGSPYPAEACAIYSAFRAGKSVRIIDEVFWRKDGTSFPVEYVSSPIIDDGIVRGAVVTFADVTERRRLERRLEQIGRINSLGRMAVTIGHEFNNVLMGIQPFAEVIRRRAGDDAKLQQAATQILNSVTRGKGITQDIMRMTKSPEPNLQSVDVTPWLEQLAVEIRALVGKSVAVDLQLPSSGTLFARCDPSQMQQVMTNLALNARDAMPGGGTLSLSVKRSEAGARLVIGDTGCGIAPETLPFIFEPLFTTKHSGTGLGLAVAQQLVIRNGGTIGVESSLGTGTWFHIDLPEAPAVNPAATAEVSVPRTHSGVRRVVIVEDDPIVASGLASVLESEDVKVHVVNRGSEAMDAVAAFEPDAVVIDISLPDVSGTVVYEQIAARWPEMGIIFSTGHADESGLTQASSRHVGFLRKPYSSDTLLTKLREVV
jgi:PAS domain S-box-containing protein